VPALPAFDPTTQINQSPHVVLLGAGASRAAFPNGDANGRRLPVLLDLPDCLGLRDALRAAGFASDANFEQVYDELATSGRNSSLKAEIESKVRSYFESLVLPETPTLYDYLLLALREGDLIATFNWDPFLTQAFKRNRSIPALPQIVFLHGNVEIAVCIEDRMKGFRGDVCTKCGKPLVSTTLLYPVRNKDYSTDPFIANEWSLLKDFLGKAYMLTIFGYSAPTTDAAAVDLMAKKWGDNPAFEFAQASIVDIKPEAELEKTWEPFLCRDHYGIHESMWTTWIFRHPRRSGEALAMATLQNDPWRENPFPKLKSLSHVHAWLAPLIAEEQNGRFTGNPCLHPEDFSGTVSEKPKKIGRDSVLCWLQLMCRGEIIPPFCVEVVLRDGTRYSLHSVLDCDEETHTICFRIWDLRALSEADVAKLKQKLNKIRSRKDLAPAEKLHRKLDWANVRAHYDDISYCVEWHDRIWPRQ
jgi:hypothetical protein